MAINYQAAFPNLIENIYSSSKFLFRHAKKQRAEASYKAFAEGLFGQGASEHIKLPPIPEKDMLLTVNIYFLGNNFFFCYYKIINVFLLAIRILSGIQCK